MHTNASKLKAIVNLFLFLLLTSITYAALSDYSIASYSFENLPSTTAEDYSSNNKDLDLTIAGVQNNIIVKLGNWAANTSRDNGLYMTLPQPDYTLNFSSGHNFSVSAWVNMPALNHDVNYTSSIVTIGETFDIHYVMVTQGDDFGIYIQNSYNVYGDTCAGIYEIKDDYNMSANTWYNVVYNIERIASNNFNISIYVNGVLTKNENYNPGGTWGESKQGNATIRIGNPLGCTAGTQPFATGLMNATAYIDQVDIFNTKLSSSDISVLYASGDGINIYDESVPYQVASIAPVGMVFNSYKSKQTGDYFIGETYTELSFDYENSTNVLSYSGVDTASFDSFAIQYTDATTVDFWSFNSIVNDVENMQIRACNTYGCSDWADWGLTVDYTGTGAYQLASISDITMATDSSLYRTFSDYFTGYSYTYFKFTNPDTFDTTLVSEGFPNNNSCFYSGITDDNLIIISNSAACEVNDVYMLVDDGETSILSNVFNIYVYAGDTTESGIVRLFGGLFPESNTISPRARMTYVIVTMIITLLIGLFIIWNSHASMFVGIGIGAVMFVEFIFFTTISYIPILWVALFSVAVVVGGAAWFTRKTIGGGD